MIKTFRFRLTAWYLGLMAVLFAGFSVFLYELLARSLAARLDEMLVSEAATAATLLPDEMEEEHGDIAKAAEEVVTEIRFQGGRITIYQGERLIATSGPAQGDAGGRSATREVSARGAAFRIVAAAPADAIAGDLRLVRGVIFIGLPVFLGLAGLSGYWLTKRQLRPLETMAEQAHRISSSNLNARLETGPAAEELAVLAASFNELLGRLDQSFETMRRFVADASHELRTPLAVIRGEADVALAQERGAGEYRESLAVILDESQRLSRLVEDLLNLARADAGRVRLQVGDFYFNDLLAECCRGVQGRAGAQGVTLECRAGGDVPFRGDEGLLRRLVANLLDNAIRYTPAGGRVTAEVEAQGTGVRLRIADTGVGIPAEAAPHVFERFFRADQARSRADGGFGLGLAIVKWIAESHRGAVEVESGAAKGSTFTVTLPG
jgi:two-component system, OmpR family, sensor kinase